MIDIPESLQLEIQFYWKILESIPHPFYVIDARDYSIKMANSATTQLGEIDEYTTCHALTHNRKTPCKGSAHLCPLEEVKRTGQPVTLEHIHYNRDGETRYIEVHGYPVFDTDGKVAQMIEYCLDITQRKLAEEALQKAHDELERRVAERTAELTRMNETLRYEIEERQRTEEKLLKYQQRLRQMSSEMTLLEERQRRRIAVDLHDSIGQTLAVSKMKLAEARKQSKSRQLIQELTDIYDLIDETIKYVRTLIPELSPPILYELGLEAAIEWLLEKFEDQYPIKIRFETDGQPKTLSDDFRVVLFQAVRELVMNTIKHAKASLITVSVTKNGDFIVLEIIDNGSGFDFAQLDSVESKDTGFGLFSVRERLNALGGHVEIESGENKGTRVTLKAPVK